MMDEQSEYYPHNEMQPIIDAAERDEADYFFSGDAYDDDEFFS